MSWPTSDQFDKAAENGHEYALQEWTDGRRQRRESPLSGEWADDVTMEQIARNVGYTTHHADTAEELADARDELADAWERGYNDAWSHSLPEEQTT